VIRMLVLLALAGQTPPNDFLRDEVAARAATAEARAKSAEARAESAESRAAAAEASVRAAEARVGSAQAAARAAESRAFTAGAELVSLRQAYARASREAAWHATLADGWRAQAARAEAAAARPPVPTPPQAPQVVYQAPQPLAVPSYQVPQVPAGWQLVGWVRVR
jgi:hypothetical protein